MLARHVFRGLERPLSHADNMHADQDVIVYTWRSQVDYEWEGSPFNGNPVERTPPPGRVFVVLVREEASDDLGVFGSIERWNWVREDPGLPHAPVEWEYRYTKRLWSK